MSRFKMPTLLLITENPSIRSSIKKYLFHQFFIIEASQKFDILDVVRSSSLDLIILDGEMEKCLALCKEMRELLFTASTPILLITGKLKKQFRDEALEAGVSDFLSEQLDPEELETRIAIGRKAASVREKTAELSTAIRPAELISTSYLKSKLLLHDQAIRILTASKNEQEATTLLLIQIDRIQLLQNELGHWAVDALFLSLSQFIHRFLKKDDLLISSSENRLILLLNQTSLTQAKFFADKLRKEVENYVFHTPKGDRWITISVAYSTLEASEASLERMVDTAVKSLSAQNNVNFTLKLEQT